MSKEKQIEEMAKYCPCYFGDKCCIDGELPEKCDMLCQFGTYAEIIYNAGYRKQSEVAREIFEEIGREINDALKSNYKALPQFEQSDELWNRINGKIDALRGLDGFIAELKKKYTEENDG